MSYRIRELRERLNLKQEELGARLDVTRQTIAAWEKGQREPSITQLTKIAQVLGVPTELLLRQENKKEQTVHLLFRADNPGALTDLDQALLAHRAENYVDIEQIMGSLPLLPESRPLMEYQAQSVERVARETRDWLGVEDAPLGDVIALLERKGLKVITAKLPDRIWGFSAYTEEWGGIIFVNTQSEGDPIAVERQYFTALHELGHLIFHRKEYSQPSTPTTKRDPREDIANHFAGAVLLPAEALKYELQAYEGRWLPEPLLLDIKLKYGASVGTIIMRAAQLGLITEKQKGQQLGKMRKEYAHNHGEPDRFTLQKPPGLSRLELLVYGAVVKDQISESRAAEVLQCPLYKLQKELENWYGEDIEA